MLLAPQEKWRVFLHPSQRRLVDRHWNGPVRVLGGAGTGKTVVAMHRAKWLLNNHAIKPENRILFVTFTANLAANLKSNLQSLIISEEKFQRLEVVHLDQWVYRFLRQHEFAQQIVYDPNDDRLQDSWNHGMESQEKGFKRPLNFYQDEWQKVVLDQGLFTRDAYLQVLRTGRGTPLTRPQRARVWKVFEAYRAHLRLEGFIEKEEAYYAARNIIEAKATPLPYVSVIVDESQDFGNEAFRLIKTLAHAAVPTDTAVPNRLFLVGDAHQRIYDSASGLEPLRHSDPGTQLPPAHQLSHVGAHSQDSGICVEGRGSGRFGWGRRQFSGLPQSVWGSNPGVNSI